VCDKVSIGEGDSSHESNPDLAARRLTVCCPADSLPAMSDSAIDASAAVVELRRSYIDLLKKSLTMTLWDAGDGAQEQPFKPPLRTRAKQVLKGLISNQEKPQQQDLKTLRMEGRDWPNLAHTMIGVKRMENLQFCVEEVIRNGVPGDLIETGVWRGGACIFMRGILKAYGVTDRTVWVADSFAGLPPPNPEKYPADAGDVHHRIKPLAISLEQVKENFAAYGLLDGQVQFLKGWFKDTLPGASIRHLAVARLDGDMYESTMDALKHLWPKLSVGGYLIVDDYGIVAGCRRAVEDFRKVERIEDPIQDIDGWGVFWQRSK
jgi:O-methyltransferase